MPNGQIWTLVLADADDRADSSPDVLAERMRETLNRAMSASPRRQIIAVVPQEQRRNLLGPLWFLPASNVVAYPHRGGTGTGILLALARVLARDPGARVLVVPADHRVNDEEAFSHALRHAAIDLAGKSDRVFLLGVKPTEARIDYRYLVPGARDRTGSLQVTQLVDRPNQSFSGPTTNRFVQRLIELRALWNTGIVASSGRSLWQLFERDLPAQALADLRETVRRAVREHTDLNALEPAVTALRSLKFDHVLKGQERFLGVMPIPGCGWQLATSESAHSTAADDLKRAVAPLALLAAPPALHSGL